MKIYMGPYKSDRLSLVTVIDKVFFFLSEKKKNYIFDKLYKGKIDRFLTWISSKLYNERNIKIHIDGYDVWSLDHTLAMIIVPCLKELKKQKHGAPFVYDIDVPDHLKRYNAPPREYYYDTDTLFFDRWDWVLDEMIYGFEFTFIQDDLIFQENGRYNFDEYNAKSERASNGRRLFAKYYEGLWD